MTRAPKHLVPGAPCRAALLFLAAALAVATAWAQPAGPGSSPPAASPKPPRVALVLSGGGARGFAHIGVLRALNRLGVPVDMVAGASMGAVVGGAFAAGRSAEELAEFALRTDWDAVVGDRARRDDLSLRRKTDDLDVPSRLEFGVGRDGLRLPPAAVGNAALESTLARLLPPDAMARPASAQALPFRAVATDLLTGELVELSDTPMFHSLRASMAVPGVFSPVRLGARLVVDGGLVRNLPVDLAQALGAQVIIAVNVGTPLAGEETLGSALGVAEQMLNILTEQNVQRSLARLRPSDVLVTPDLKDIGFLDFRSAAAAIEAGDRATMALADRLRPLAVDHTLYAAHESARLAPRPDLDRPRPLARLEVQSAGSADGRTLAAETGLQVGQGITLAQVQRSVSRLFGRGDFERVVAEMRDGPGGRELLLTPTAAEGARSRVRLGLELSSDFSDDHRVSVSALHLLSWLNPWGGELRTLARAGSTRALGTQWWQPLGPGSPWFTEASIDYVTDPVDFFTDGRRQARASVTSTSAMLALGRQFGNSAELRIGITRAVGRGRVIIPQPVDDGAVPFSETWRFALLRYDTLNALAFPTDGALLQLEWAQTARPAPGEPSLAQTQLRALQAFRVDEWGGHVYLEWAKSRSGFAPLSLGGFLRLTGAPRDSISGATVLLGRAVLARRIGQMPPGLGGAVRTGLSLELGEGFAADESVTLRRLRPAASAFLSVDTRVGPAYLAVGATPGSGATLYLFLGPYW